MKHKKRLITNKFLFDGCGICDATQAAATTGHSLSLSELKDAFRKANQRQAVRVANKAKRKIPKW